MFLALLGLSKEGFRLNDDDLSKLKEKTERALAMDGTSSSEAEEEVSIATMLGLDADASDSDGEHMVFDPSRLRDASDFVSVDVRVVEYKGRTLFHTKAFLMDTMDCLKENILAIIYAKTPAKHFHRRMSMDGFDLLYDDKTMDESLTLHDDSDEGVSVHTVALHLKIKGGGLSRGVSKHIVKSRVRSKLWQAMPMDFRPLSIHAFRPAEMAISVSIAIAVWGAMAPFGCCYNATL